MHNSVFLGCNILWDLYVVHVLCCICKFHLIAMSGFNATLGNVKFLLNPLVCLTWLVFSNHCITKSCYYETKIFAGLVICVLVTSSFSFSRAVNFIFLNILILHCTVVLVCRWRITPLDIKLKDRTDNIGLKIMSVLSFGLWCHFLTEKVTGHGGGKYIEYDIY